MKIVILTKKYGKNYNGATLTTQYLVSKWHLSVENINVFTIETGEYDKFDNVSVVVEKNEIKLAELLKKHAKKHSDDIYYSDDHLGYILSRQNIKYYHTYHGNWPDARYSSIDFFFKSFYFMPLYVKTFKNAQCVINVSKYMTEYTRKYNDNYVVIRNGMDIKHSTNNHKKNQSVVLVGNVDKRKYLRLPYIAKEIEKKNSNIKFYIYGNIMDKKFARRLSSLSNIRLMSAVNEIPYGDYSVFLNVSQMENLSLSVCEAIYNGIPVYCFDVGGMREIVTEQNGMVIEKFDDSKMILAILEFFDDKNKYDMDMDVLKEFNWDICANKYLRLFEGR